MKTSTMAAIAVVVCLVISPAAFAASIGVSSTFFDQGTADDPMPDAVVISNDSTDANILSVTWDISTAALNVPVFDTLDGASPDYAYGEEAGSPVTAIEPEVSGFVVPSEAEQASWEEAQVMTLSFTDFEPGEIFAFNIDLDDLIDFRLTGEELAGATLAVLFATGQTLTLVYEDVPGGILFDATGSVSAAVIPLPAGLWLALSALSVLAFGGRKRRA